MISEAPSSRRPVARLLLAVLLCAGTTLLAFIAGTALGGRYLVPPGQGLAGPAEAMGYGLLAAVAAILVAAMISAILDLKRLAWTTGLILFVAAGVFGATIFVALTGNGGAV